MQTGPTSASMYLIRAELQLLQSSPDTACIDRDFKEAYKLKPQMVDQYLRLKTHTPSFSRSVVPSGNQLRTVHLTGINSAGTINLRPLFGWPISALPDANIAQEPPVLRWADDEIMPAPDEFDGLLKHLFTPLNLFSRDEEEVEANSNAVADAAPTATAATTVSAKQADVGSPAETDDEIMPAPDFETDTETAPDESGKLG